MSGCRFSYEALSPALKARVDAALASEHGRREGDRERGCGKAAAGVPGGRRPNKTEAAYGVEVLGRRTDVEAMRYEGLTFRMANGHRYTPDWLVVTKEGRIECHEVKGRYALQSQQRARLAFDQARVEFPWLVWVWAVRSARGWEIASEQQAGGSGQSARLRAGGDGGGCRASSRSAERCRGDSAFAESEVQS